MVTVYVTSDFAFEVTNTVIFLPWYDKYTRYNLSFNPSLPQRHVYRHERHNSFLSITFCNVTLPIDYFITQ